MGAAPSTPMEAKKETNGLSPDQLIGAIFNLARSLNLECVFEGIETEMQLMEVTLAGFHYAQGYFIERPVALQTVLGQLQPVSGATGRSGRRPASTQTAA